MNRNMQPNLDVSGESLYRDVVHYAEMGHHRTASPADRQTSEWIAARMESAGFSTTRLPWRLRQFSVDECWVRLYGSQLDAFPLWHPKAIGDASLVSELAFVENLEGCAQAAGRISLISFPGQMVTTRSGHDSWINALADAGAKAIIGCAPHASGEIYGQNAIPPFNQTPWPVPVLCVAPRDWHVLRHAAELGDPVEAMLRGVDDMSAEAVSVIGHLDRGREYIIISTPQSGWFRSSGERGTGIALLLDLIRWLSARPGGPSLIAMSNPGHEIGHMGIHHVFENFPLPPPEQVRAWLHLGSSIAIKGWCEESGTLKANGVESDSWLLCSEALLEPLRAGFAELPHIEPEVYDRDHGEIRWILEAGYNGFSLMGPGRFFHLPGDGPEVTSPTLLRDVAKALRRTLDVLAEW